MPFNNMGYGGMGGFVPYGYLSAQVRQSQDNPEEAAEFQKRITLQTIANMLIQQGQQPLQGQMVGRFYVPPSPAQGVANMANTMLGAYLAGKGTKDYIDEAKVHADEARQAQAKVAEAMKAPTREIPAVPPQPLQGPGAPMRVPMKQTYPRTQFDSPYLPDELRPTASYTIEGPQPMTPGIPARTEVAEDTPMDKYNRIQQAMIEMDPRVQERVMPYLTMQGEQVKLAQQRQAHLEELNQKQEFQAEQSQLNRESNLQRDKEHGDNQSFLAAIAGVNKRDIESMRAELERQKMAENKQLTVAQDPQSPTGWSHFDAATGKVVVRGAAPPMASVKADAASKEAPRKLSAQEQKELFESEDSISSSQNAASALRQALTLNEKAYSGPLAKQRATALSAVPGVKNPEADATIDVDNLITGQALESLRATFGGMPTEGERKVLLDMQGSVNLQPQQRREIWERALKLAERREQINRQKSEQLRSGEYMQPGGGTANVPAIDYSKKQAPMTSPDPGTAVKPVAPFDDAEKEKRYQEFKKNHK